MASFKNTTVSDTGFIQVAAGTTAQRPSPSTGMIRYNTSTGTLEGYTASSWVTLNSASS